eukprot:1731796-Pyramimonas_sp.AAC.1
MVPRRRHFYAALKSGDSVSRACRGHCTLWPIFQSLQWPLRATQHGTTPLTTHTGQEWPRDESLGHQRPLMFSEIHLFIKGGWAECGHSLGLAP